jgi:hypothetical protein
MEIYSTKDHGNQKEVSINDINLEIDTSIYLDFMDNC